MGIIKFTDLNAWKEGRKLVLMIYKLTKSFPKSENFYTGKSDVTCGYISHK